MPTLMLVLYFAVWRLLWLWSGRANREMCRDCANLAVDLDWSALQILVDINMEE